MLYLVQKGLLPMTLTEASYLTRRVVSGILLVTILYFSGKITWEIGKAIYRYLFPPPPPGPELLYGKLPSLNLKSLPIKSSPTYSLETPTGALPEDFPLLVEVFKLPTLSPSLLAEKKAKELAQALGFKSEPLVLSSTDYIWEDKAFNRRLRLNIVNKNFTLKSDLKDISISFPPGSVESEREAVSKAKSFLSGKELLDSSYEEGTFKTSLLKIEGQNLRQAFSLSDAQLIKIDFFRNITANQSSFPILGPNPKEGLIQVFTSGGGGADPRKFPTINYTFQKIDPEEKSTYPLKSIETAWSELKSGKGFLTYLNILGTDPNLPYTPLSPTRVVIHKIYLAYFENEKFFSFLQPVFVFEGKADIPGGEKAEFIAFIQAVDSGWME